MFYLVFMKHKLIQLKPVGFAEVMVAVLHNTIRQSISYANTR